MSSIDADREACFTFGMLGRRNGEVGWALAAMLLLLGCSGLQAGGQTGDEGAVPSPFSGADNDACAGAVRTELDGLDAVGRGDYSPADVLAYAEDTFSLPVRWHARPLEYADFPDMPEVTIAPATSRSVTVSVAYRGGALQARDMDDDAHCHRLEIEVEVELTSDDGGLREAVPGILVAYSRTDAQLSLHFTTGVVQVSSPRGTHEGEVSLHPLMGDLSVTTDADELLAFARVNLTLSPLGGIGTLQAWVHGPGSVWRSVGTVATLGEP